MSRNCFLSVLGFFFLFVSSMVGSEILVNTRDGEVLVLDIDPEETLYDLKDKVAFVTNGRGSHAIVDCSNSDDLKDVHLKQVRNQGQYLGYPRTYFAAIHSHEKEDIHFILSNLANKSLISIALMKPDLEAAGYRIDHLHPLRFLMTVFSDEELKVLIRNLRTKSVWKHFIGGLKDSLTTEASIGNMKIEYVLDFSEQLKLCPNLIADSISTQMWDDLVDVLISHIPRLGNYDRYDS